jgi:putative Ca2+/H+ antiporter (TMEM165/GDT1 family)
MLASLVLGTRYRPLPVFLGVAAAFAVHVCVAVAIGGIFSLLPRRLVLLVVTALFAAGAVVLLLGRDERPEGTASASARCWRCGRRRPWPSRSAVACCGASRPAWCAGSPG